MVKVRHRSSLVLYDHFKFPKIFLFAGYLIGEEKLTNELWCFDISTLKWKLIKTKNQIEERQKQSTSKKEKQNFLFIII